MTRRTRWAGRLSVVAAWLIPVLLLASVWAPFGAWWQWLATAFISFAVMQGASEPTPRHEPGRVEVCGYTPREPQ